MYVIFTQFPLRNQLSLISFVTIFWMGDFRFSEFQSLRSHNFRPDACTQFWSSLFFAPWNIFNPVQLFEFMICHRQFKFFMGTFSQFATGNLCRWWAKLWKFCSNCLWKFLVSWFSTGNFSVSRPLFSDLPRGLKSSTEQTKIITLETIPGIRVSF